MLPAGIAPDQVVLKKRTSIASASRGDASKQHMLIQIKGRRSVKSWVVEKTSASLNSGDVFILDAGDKIFQWNGSKCNRLERSKGVDMTTRMNRARGSKAKIIVIDEGDTEPDEAFAF